MAAVEEGKFAMSDGFEVYTRTWKPSTQPIAALVFVHGFSDHVNRYNVLMDEIAAAGVTVYAFDQRGWGKSVRQKSDQGLTGPSTQVLGDIASFVKSKVSSSIPLFMMGHSMGGQETLHFIATGPEDVKKQIKGFILSSAYVALHPAEQPGWLKVRAGRLACSVLPRYQLYNPLKPERISHDQKWNDDIRDDPLCHDFGTLEGLAGMLDRAEQLDTRKVMVKDWDGLNLLFLHGDGDEITAYASTRAYYEAIAVKNKDMITYPGAYHCVFYEPEHKKNYTKDILDFITARLKDSPTSKL